MNKREFLMQAHTYVPLKHSIAGHWASIKLDGHRMFWDGGISRGIPCSEVPWANTEKDHIKINAPVATGLWSRGAKAIQAPEWFLNELPRIPLDGEAWAGVNTFQFVSSVLRKDTPVDEEWEKIKLVAFDSPCIKNIFADGTFSIRDHKIKLKDAVQWAYDHATCVTLFKSQPSVMQVYSKLEKLEQNNCWALHEQHRLSYGPEGAIEAEERMKAVLKEGHEGLVVRDPMSMWEPTRTNNVLKMKPHHDAEGIIVGFTFGKEGKEGKYHGLMGALIVNWKGKEFKVSGFTDVERTLKPEDIYYAKQHPGEVAPSNMDVPMFPKYTEITFKYRELTKDGIPKEARFLR